MFDHWESTIYWDQMSWEAFAALVTGLAVAIGATVVGLRQLALQQLTLRLAMFDRRYAIYRATARWIGFILTDGRIPNREGSSSTDAVRRERDFLDAIDESRFVFGPHVFTALEKLWQQGNQLHHHQASAKRTDDPDRNMHIDHELQIHLWFAEQSKNLGAVFGDELRVSDGGKSSFRPLTDRNTQ